MSIQKLSRADKPEVIAEADVGEMHSWCMFLRTR